MPFIKLSSSVSLLICVFMVSACTVVRSYPLPKRPSFILILTDDQNVASLEHMPNVQKLLVEKGVSFSNMFVTTPLCCPSRASILRGQYAHNHLVKINREPNGGFQRFYEQGLESSTIATWLEQGGYKTMFLGKYLNNYPSDEVTKTYVPEGWDEWHAVTRNHYFNYTINHNGKLRRYGSEEADYETDVLTQQAKALLEKSSNKSFFMYLAPFAPHNNAAEPFLNPPTPAPRHKETFQQLAVSRAPSFNEPDVTDKPTLIRDKPLLAEEEIVQFDDLYRKRLQSLLAVDDMVAELVKTLEKTGQLDNTYIVFTSDNGWLEGQHRVFGGKIIPYEESIRVPLVIRGPGLKPGQRRDELVLNIDLAPTFAELAKVTPPDFVDGRSLVPLFSEAPPPTWRQAFVVEGWREDEEVSELVPWYISLRTATQKYTQWLSPEAELEFYDLTADPLELTSLHTSLPPETQEKFSVWLEALSTCQADECRRLEDSPP
jgi:N-acetylglucosamine-6-sulfatase